MEWSEREKIFDHRENSSENNNEDIKNVINTFLFRSNIHFLWCHKLRIYTINVFTLNNAISSPTLYGRAAAAVVVVVADTNQPIIKS